MHIQRRSVSVLFLRHIVCTLVLINRAQAGLVRALYSIKRALYSIKRAPYSTKRALYSTKRALNFINRAIYSIKRAPHTCIFIANRPLVAQVGLKEV